MTNPIIVTRKVTLSSAAADVELGFLPNYVECYDLAAASSTTQIVRGKPDEGSSSAQMMAFQNSSSATVAAAMNSAEITQVSLVGASSVAAYGIAITSGAGFASSADVMVHAYRTRYINSSSDLLSG